MYASVFSIRNCTEEKAISKALTKVIVPKFVPDKSLKIAANEEEAAEEKKKHKEVKSQGLKP
eukprot:361732-Amorphochlora_amoeboformis.AAC.1